MTKTDFAPKSLENFSETGVSTMGRSGYLKLQYFFLGPLSLCFFSSQDHGHMVVPIVQRSFALDNMFDVTRSNIKARNASHAQPAGTVYSSAVI